MIYIEKNTLNQVVLELTAAAPIGWEYFIFELTWQTEATDYKRYLILDDLAPSGAQDRYNLFSINEDELGSTAQIVDNGTVFLNPGQYKVKIYASPNPIDPTDIFPVISGPIIQTQRMVVDGSDPTTPEVYQSVYVNTYTPSVYD